MISASELLVTAFSLLGLRAAGMIGPDRADAAATVTPRLPNSVLASPLHPPVRDEPLLAAITGALREAGYLNG